MSNVSAADSELALRTSVAIFRERIPLMQALFTCPCVSGATACILPD
jgi:hypothetical protein